MERNLIPQPDAPVAVTCNGQPSHSFDLHTLIPEWSSETTNPSPVSQPLDDPVTYGHALCAALFPADLPVQQALAAESEQILLVIEDPTLHIGQSRTLSPSVGEAPVARRNAGLISVNPHKRVERQCASAYSDC